MTCKSLNAEFVSLYYGIINVRRVLLNPTEKSRAKIKAYFFIIVNETDDSSSVIKYSCRCIRRVAFTVYSFIPIMIWISGFLSLYTLQPGVFPGRLIKMSV